MNEARVRDACRCRPGGKLRAHAGRGIDDGHFAATQGQGERHTSGPTTDVEEDVLGPYIGRQDRQVGIQRTVRIGVCAGVL